MPRALIIDDESASRLALRAVLADHAHVTIVGEAGSLADARTLLADADYDLVFLDIQLRKGTGFDLVPHVRPGARIIFVTAYDRHALRAFEVNALDYLLKPIAPERLAQALARLTQPSPAPATTTAPSPLTPDDRLLLSVGAGAERFVRLGDIRAVTSFQNYTEVNVGPAGEKLLVRRTIQAWEAALPPAHFVRVHRQALINVAHAVRLERHTDSVSHLTLDGLATPVTVSAVYLPTLRQQIAARPA